MKPIFDYDLIKNILETTTREQVLAELEFCHSEYINWFKYMKIPAFNDRTPQQILDEFGPDALIHYLEHKMHGGFE